MRQGGKDARLKVFATLEADLRNTLVGKRGVILCPLCMGEFDLAAAETGLLTEEHVIPASTGNREVTLSCKKCNNTLGHEIDEQIARKVRLDRARDGGIKLRTKMKWAEGGAAVDLEYRDESSLHLHVKNATPTMTASLLERAQQHNSGERPITFRLFTGVRPSAFLAAVTKAAYLGLFVDRGYNYILLPWLDPIRKAIREDGDERARLNEVIVPCQIAWPSDEPLAPTRLTFETASLGGVSVCLSVVNLNGSSDAAWVVLPPGTAPNVGSWDGLARAADKLRGKTNVQVTFEPDGKVEISGLD